ncbi:DUF4350 domain-containing protein [Pontimicrobium sp. IMCC45349]|uniref:DUF4350 domain-containing protein n=1 Tax=Pontimicrobium sp. IMCC45349 TaxID=3391574 RepID=UPI0039A2DA58
MKNNSIIAIIIVVLVIVIVALTNIGKSRIIDWEESFNEKSNKPYGVSVLYKELPKLYKDNKVRTVYYTPSTYLYANSEDGYGEHVAEGTFMIIGNSDYLDYSDIEELMIFASNGNTVFISDFYPPEVLSDTLNLDVDYLLNKKDSISRYRFKNNLLTNRKTIIDKSDGDFFFRDVDNPNIKVLGYASENDERPNFIKMMHGDGAFYFHLNPKVFTNYHILKNEHYKHVEGVLSYLPNENLYFDSYSKIYNSYYGDAEKESNYDWFLDQQAFKWAWYLAILFALIFAVFNAKRRQRIIKIIKPLENTSLGFVKTISNLYFETQDYKNLIDKKITYFLEKIRTEYNLDTSVLDEDFIERLSLKSGKKKDVIIKLINYINWLDSKNEFFEENLVNLNRHIEAFYSK